MTEQMPKTEVYGLSSQMRRAAISVPANVAEGFRRKHSKEFRQFLSISLGSLAELETHVVIATELAYLSSEVADGMLEYVDHLSRMITNLMKRL